MRIKWRLIEKPIAACMVLLLAAPIARAEPLPGQEAAAGQATQPAPPTVTQQAASTPDSAPNPTPAPTAQSPAVESQSSSSTTAPGEEGAKQRPERAGEWFAGQRFAARALRSQMRINNRMAPRNLLAQPRPRQ